MKPADVQPSGFSIPNGPGIPTYPSRPPLLVEVVQAVCAQLGVSERDLRRSPTRGSAPLARARAIAMYLARADARESWPSIGHCFGRDHTTALQRARDVEAMLDAGDERLAADVAAVRARVLVRLRSLEEPLRPGEHEEVTSLRREVERLRGEVAELRRNMGEVRK